MFAVLEDGIACFQKHLLARDRRGERLFCEAEEWMLDDDTDWLFSFENICQVLGLEPQLMRQQLLRWKENEYKKRLHSSVFYSASNKAKCKTHHQCCRYP